MLPTGCRRNSSDVATPKLPPPPRRAQKRSSFSSSLARSRRPSAVTTSAAMRLSHDRPYLRARYPMPPPNVRPPTPVVEITPPVVDSPRASVVHPVVDLAGVVVARRTGFDDLPADSVLQTLDACSHGSPCVWWTCAHDEASGAGPHRRDHPPFFLPAWGISPTRSGAA